MDPHRFDTFTRRLAAGTSRRTILKGLLAGSAGLAIKPGMASAQTACEPACETDELCCNGTCQFCCVTEDCPDLGDCHTKSCSLGGMSCSYSQNPSACTGACQLCSDEFICTDGCGAAQVCCDTVCMSGDCCGTVDCSAGEVCCENQCEPGVCCTEADCLDTQCAVVSCTDNICTAVSLCPPPASCCPTATGDICVNALEEGTCCTAEECEPVINIEGTCFEIVCFDNLCGFVPDDERCEKPECCCENGECSADCCESTSECEHDLDCDKGECCCKDGTCSSHCCEDPRCRHDKDCGKGECCCKDGSCSKLCCDDDPKPDSGTSTIDTLPSTGTGVDTDNASWFSGAAMIGGAAAIIAAKSRREARPEEEAEA